MTELTQLDLLLREIKCYSLDWFQEMGGHQARLEVARLRADNLFLNGLAERFAKDGDSQYREIIKLRERIVELENRAELAEQERGELLLWREAAKNKLEIAERVIELFGKSIWWKRKNSYGEVEGRFCCFCSGEFGTEMEHFSDCVAMAVLQKWNGAK